MPWAVCPPNGLDSSDTVLPFDSSVARAQEALRTMQDQCGKCNTWLPDSDEVARFILNILVQRHPSLVTIDELVRELAAPSLQQRIEAPLIADGLADLATSGLVHRVDNYVLATRTAMRARDLIV